MRLQFVIGAPGGGGKVPLLPEYVEEINDDEVIFSELPGQRFTYKQPKRSDGSETPDIVPIESRQAADRGEEGEPAEAEEGVWE